MTSNISDSKVLNMCCIIHQRAARMNKYTPHIMNETVRIQRHQIKYTRYTQERKDIPERYQGETKRYHGEHKRHEGENREGMNRQIYHV